MTESAVATRERTPVFDFDYIAGADILADVHGAYLALKQTAPPLFWTPHNGGHWVVTGASAAMHVLRHPEHFSNRILSIPPNPMQQRMIPESLDPPEHRAYRQLLRPWFESKAIEPLEPRITAWAEKMIGDVAPKGGCEFVDALGSRFPISVFMELFGFPLEKFEAFRTIVNGFFKSTASDEQRAAWGMQIVGILMQLFEERRAEPRDDLISKLLVADFEGRKLELDELISIGFLMFLAGLDTVVNALTFGMRHLAHDVALRQRMIDDPDCIPAAVEELMRRYSFVAVPRHIVADVELEGVQLRAGESILVPLNVVGWDPGMTADPETVSLDRPHCRHAAFGSGIHTCLGIHLARLEMQIFYRTWLARVGHFHEVPSAPAYRGGSVQALESLTLAWETKA